MTSKRGRIHLFNFSESIMDQHLKAYAWFIGFMLVTAVVVKPIATQMNIPLLKDL